MGRTVRTLLAFAVLGAAALASPGALAEGADPTSARNVAPQASATDIPALEAQRKALFARMITNPGDLDTAFAYATLSVQLGDIEGAISTLERMLIFAPGLPQLQLELGVLYYRLGAFDTATVYFEAAAGAPDVPPEVLQRIEVYLAATEQRAEPSSFSGSLTTGVRVQSNANAGPLSPFVTIAGFEFLLGPDALARADANAFATANVNASVDLESQGDRFDLMVMGHGTSYRELTELNTGIVEVRAGPSFNLQRIDIDNTRLGLYGIGSVAALDGELYLASGGLGANLASLLDAQSRVLFQLEGRHEEHFDTTARPSASTRTGQRYNATASYQHQVAPNIELFGALSGQRRQTAYDYLSDWHVGATAGAVFKLQSLVPVLEDDWSLALAAGVRHEIADAPDFLFDPTNPRQSTTAFGQGSLTVPIGEGFAVQTTATYSRSVSNHDMGNHDNYGASLGLSKGF